MDTHNLFNDKSEIYARARPRYPEALYQWLASQCQERKMAWDAACGNGQAAAGLRKYFQFVEATDISPAQIANAPTYERVRFSVQPSEKTTFADNSFDAVCVAQAIHWFDHDRFWPEVRRVLKPGGIFAAWGYSWLKINNAVDTILQEKLFPILEPYWPPQNQLLWNNYKDIHMPFPRIEPPQMSLEVHWDIDDLFGFLHSWSATRRCMNDIGEAFFWDVQKEVAALWGGEGHKKVTMDLIFLVGRNDKT